MFVSRTVLVLCAFATAAGCTERAASDSASPPTAALVRLDTLAESESLFVARVTRALVADDGHIFVSDHIHGRVVEFDASGALVRSIGRIGEGPGEFLGPAALALWGADSLVVTDLSTAQISVFRRSDGAFLWREFGLGSLSSLATSGPQLIAASLGTDPFTAAVVFDAGTRTPRRALGLADSLTRDTLSVIAYPRTLVAARNGQIAVGHLWSDVVQVFDSNFVPAFSFAVPRRTRRAIPPDLGAALRPILVTSERLTLIPSLMTIEWLRTGELVFFHKEWTPPSSGIPDPTRVALDASLRAFATVIDLNAQRACTDILLPTEWAENPHFLADGVEVLGLGHHIGESPRPTLELRRYSLPLAGCDWDAVKLVPSQVP